MSGRGGAVAAPITGPVFAEFVASRRVHPWPNHVSGGVRAGALYDAYVEHAREAGLTAHTVRRRGDSEEPLLSSRDFGLALREEGFGVTKDHDGYHVYSDLLDESRESIARSRAIDIVTRDEERRLWNEAQDEHDAATDHGSVRVPVMDKSTSLQQRDVDGDLVFEDVPLHCEHAPREVGPNVRALLAAYVAAHEDDIARVIEERFGPFLRDDEDEVEAWFTARQVRARQRSLARLRDAEAELVEARDVYHQTGSLGDERRVEAIEQRRRDLREELDLPSQYFSGHVRAVREPGMYWKWDPYVDGGPARREGEYVTEVPED